MNKRTTSIVSYITIIGLIVALCAGDVKGAKYHINQSLVIYLFGLLSLLPIPYISYIWSIFMLILWAVGLDYAIRQQETPVPLIGKIRILK